MNEQSKSPFITYGDWIYRAMMLLGIGLIAFLSMKFVTRTEWLADLEKVGKTLISIHEKVSVVETAVKLHQVRDMMIQDHEIRIRDLERKVK